MIPSSLFSNPFLCLGVCFCLFFYLILLPPTFCKILKHINLSCIGMQQAIIFGWSSTTKEPKSKSLFMFAEKIPGKRIRFFGPTTTDRIITRRRTRNWTRRSRRAEGYNKYKDRVYFWRSLLFLFYSLLGQKYIPICLFGTEQKNYP